MSPILIWISGILLLACGLANGQKACDPRTFSTADYPSRLTKIDVVGTDPYKLRAYFRLLNSTAEISFEGMLMASENFPSTNVGITGCRSMGCSEVASTTYVYWVPTDTCEFKCPDGKTAKRKCQFMLDSLQCKDDAMNLAECVTGQFWKYADTAPTTTVSSYYKYNGLHVVCRECGEE